MGSHLVPDCSVITDQSKLHACQFQHTVRPSKQAWQGMPSWVSIKSPFIPAADTSCWLHGTYQLGEPSELTALPQPATWTQTP